MMIFDMRANAASSFGKKFAQKERERKGCKGVVEKQMKERERERVSEKGRTAKSY
jgi:hypothetical protein